MLYCLGPVHTDSYNKKALTQAMRDWQYIVTN